MPHLVHSPHALLVTILKRDNEQFIFLVCTFQPWVLLLQLQVLGLFAYLCFRSRSRSYANCNVCIRNMLMPICLFSLLRHIVTCISDRNYFIVSYYAFLSGIFQFQAMTSLRFQALEMEILEYTQAIFQVSS